MRTPDWIRFKDINHSFFYRTYSLRYSNVQRLEVRLQSFNKNNRLDNPDGKPDESIIYLQKYFVIYVRLCIINNIICSVKFITYMEEKNIFLLIFQMYKFLHISLFVTAGTKLIKWECLCHVAFLNTYFFGTQRVFGRTFIWFSANVYLSEGVS